MFKKLSLLLIGLMVCGVAHAYTTVTTDVFISGNDVTIAHLEQFRTNVLNFCNAIDGGNIQAGTVSNDALDSGINIVNRWNESFSDFVYTGLLPTTSASLTTTIPSGTAYISGVRTVKGDTAKTFTASKWTYVSLKSDGTYNYDEKTIGSAPDTLSANHIRIARVSTDGTTIPHVRDDRLLAISLDSAQEDFQRSGLLISVVTPDNITISPGIVYHGTRKHKKTSDTTLNLGTAGDWFDGARATSTMGFVAINSDGTVELATTAPTKADTAGNTAGTLRYIVDTGDSSYWRVLAWFWMDANGSGDLTHEYSNLKEADTESFVFISGDTNITTTSNSWVDMSYMEINFYCTGERKVRIDAIVPTQCADSAGPDLGIELDGVVVADTQNSTYAGSATAYSQTAHVVFCDFIAPGNHVAKVQWQDGDGNATTCYQSAESLKAKRKLIVEEL